MCPEPLDILQELVLRFFGDLFKATYLIESLQEAYLVLHSGVFGLCFCFFQKGSSTLEIVAEHREVAGSNMPEVRVGKCFFLRCLQHPLGIEILGHHPMSIRAVSLIGSHNHPLVIISIGFNLYSIDIASKKEIHIR